MGIPVQVAGQMSPCRAPVDSVRFGDSLPAPLPANDPHEVISSSQGMTDLLQDSNTQQLRQQPLVAVPEAPKHVAGRRSPMLSGAAPHDGTFRGQSNNQPMPAVAPEALRPAAGMQVPMGAEVAAIHGTAQAGPGHLPMNDGAQGTEVRLGGMAPGAHLQFMDRVTAPGQPALLDSRHMEAVPERLVASGQPPVAMTAQTSAIPQGMVSCSCVNFVKLCVARL